MQDEHVRSTWKMTRNPVEKTGQFMNSMQPSEAPIRNDRVLRRESFHLTVQGRSLEVQRIGGLHAHAPELVFLHEGLGSISHWKDFPERVAAATGCPVTVYSRYGSGDSDILTEARRVAYMHREALDSLPELLAQLHIENPILIGHSDDASIALIHAGAGNCVRALVLLAPHVFVEDLSVNGIAQARTNFETTNLPEKLARHHLDAARTFWGWNNIWLHPDFRAWNIEEYLPRITCPILAIQGLDDQYGTMAQVKAIAKHSGGPVEILPLADCWHSPQRDQPEVVLAAIAEFVKRIRGNKRDSTAPKVVAANAATNAVANYRASQCEPFRTVRTFTEPSTVTRLTYPIAPGVPATYSKSVDSELHSFSMDPCPVNTALRQRARNSLGFSPTYFSKNTSWAGPPLRVTGTALDPSLNRERTPVNKSRSSVGLICEIDTS